MAGYSSTPLAKKLGLKEGPRNLLVAVPDAVANELSDAAPIKTLARTPPKARWRADSYDYIHIFATTPAQMETGFAFARAAMNESGLMWMSWQKKTAKPDTLLDGAMVRAGGINAGLVDVKVCAVDDEWSGHKFVVPVKKRTSKK